MKTIELDDLEPGIVRQRVIIEGHYNMPTEGEDIRNFLVGLSDVLDMRIFSGPFAWYPGSKDKWTRAEVPLHELNGFVAWTESGCHVYAWRPERFVTVDCYSCKPFNPEPVIEYSTKFFGSIDSVSFSLTSSPKGVANPNTEPKSVHDKILDRAFDCVDRWDLAGMHQRVKLVERLAGSDPGNAKRLYSCINDLREAKRVSDQLERSILFIGDNWDAHTPEENISKLEGLLLNTEIPREMEDRIIHDPRISPLIPRFQQAYSDYETRLEIDFARHFGRSTSLDQYPLYGRFAELVSKEALMGKISKDDKVLMIGSGSLPLTAILFNRFTGCTVDCYDRNRGYVDLSEKVLSSLKLSDAIHVYNRDGTTIDSNDYSAISIAALAKPKEPLLKRVWGKANVGTRILCRTSDGVRQLFYEPIDPAVLKSYTPLDKVCAYGNQTISSVLLIK